MPPPPPRRDPLSPPLSLPPPPRHDVLGAVGLSLAEAFAVLAPNVAPEIRRNLAERYRSVFIDGRYVDVVLMGLLQAEYQDD